MVLYSLHNIPYADLNDFGPGIQGTLQALFLQLSGGLALLNACVSESHFDVPALARLAQATDTTATELADELTRGHGLSFQASHVAAAHPAPPSVPAAARRGGATPEDLRRLGGPELTEVELHRALDPETFVYRRSGIGGPAPETMKTQMARASQRLEENSAKLKGIQTRLYEVQRSLSASRKEPL